MRIPALPATVRIVPRSCKDEQDPPVFVCRPLGSMEASGHGLAVNENPTLAYANIAVAQLETIESLDVGDAPFDRKKDGHVAALDPVWLWDVGQALFNRAHWTDEELGKSPSPSGSP